MNFTSAIITATATILAAAVASLVSDSGWYSSMSRKLDIAERLEKLARTDEEQRIAQMAHENVFDKALARLDCSGIRTPLSTCFLISLVGVVLGTLFQILLGIEITWFVILNDLFVFVIAALIFYLIENARFVHGSRLEERRHAETEKIGDKRDSRIDDDENGDIP